MLSDFLSDFEKYVLRAGLSGLVDVVLGLLAFGSVLAALLGGPAVKAAAVVVVILILLALFAMLISGRNRVRDELSRNRRLVAHYCNVIQRTRGAPLHIKMWDDVTVIDARGGAVETVKVVARVDDEETHFYRFRIGPAWDQPARQRANVVCVVRGGNGGPQYDTTTSWLADGRMEVHAHLPSPAKVGVDLRIMLIITWPGMCEPLMTKRVADNYLLHFAQDVDAVRYVMVLPEGETALYERIGFEKEDRRYRVRMAKNSAGLVEVSLIARDVPAKHKFGLRLELR